MKIEPIKGETIKASEKLVAKYLGDEVDPEIIESMVSGIAINVIHRDGDVIGVGTAQPMTRGYRRKFKKQLGVNLAPNTLWILDLVVDEAYRRRGIGWMLLEKIRRAYPDHALFAEVWLESEASSLGLFQHLGLKEIARVEGYWRDVYCPKCGAETCNCTAVIMYKIRG